MKVIIKLKDNFPATISTRKVIEEFCQNLELSSANEYIFDFTGISFISRSCTDELIKTLTNINCKWSIRNESNNVKSMIEAVKRTQKTVSRDYDIVAITPFLNQSELSQFLSVI